MCGNVLVSLILGAQIMHNFSLLQKPLMKNTSSDIRQTISDHVLTENRSTFLFKAMYPRGLK